MSVRVSLKRRGIDDSDFGQDKPDLQDENAKGQTSLAGGEDVADVGGSFKVRDLVGKRQVVAGNVSSGRRSQAMDTKYGAAVGTAVPTKKIMSVGEIALAPTILAAGVRSAELPLAPGQVLRVGPQDLRRKVRSAKVANLVLFVVDGSGSMAARKRMTAVKGAILSLLIDAYQKRDTVGMIAFRQERAEVVLRPTNSVELAQRQLQRLPTGGKTPLADGLLLAAKVLEQQDLREHRVEPLVVLLSDGRANVGRYSGLDQSKIGRRGAGASSNPLEEAKLAAGKIAERGWKSVVIDCESGYPRLGLAGMMAQAMGGECVKLDELSAESVSGLVRKRIEDRG